MKMIANWKRSFIAEKIYDRHVVLTSVLISLGVSEDVAAMTEDLIYTIRGSLMALPGRLAMDVAAVSTAAEASEIIRKEVYEIMIDLSRYKYDPAKYEERVRTRRDWMEQDFDDE